ncbi:DotD/TraH family lipoprotein [Pseudomonas sp. MAG002Y]|uniref:DotD/TraH family lipoprotein n=1 Tax=Pseudomonas sp. MAG002Y TaxID=2678690 RepID=UPI001C6093FC|nr:DotD/TraH family lipoprotein [Pseudomonas sp. MAG002Y]MBW5416289.1 DotD/TraH family lipoprotein [Pseudomonas sp. MAG002Y]
MKYSLWAAQAAALLLSGCQSFCGKPPATPTPPATVAPVVNRAPVQQELLWMEGAINTRSALPFDAIRTHEDLVTVDWNGDAVELLSHLARQRGQRFAWAGVRLPLPVNVRVSRVTYANLLRLIEMQTAWRATLTQLPGQITLVFAQATPAKKAGGRQ